jgi:magnesium transporter
VHVDTSFNGILRRWGLGRFRWIKDQFISWKYVQPLSLEDAVATDAVSLSVTRRQLRELPPEDLADALEELSGKEQEALFSALDPETAAETLLEAEPRARRQLIADLRKERARSILAEMSIPQLAGLLTVLPHDDAEEMLGLLPADKAKHIKTILSREEAKARDLMDQDFLTFAKESKVGEVLVKIRLSGREHHAVSYVYVVGDDGKTLVGVVDLRELVLAGDTQPISEIMVSPVVTVEHDDIQEDLAQVFGKYHYRMIPVVDPQDQLLGVVRYNDIMRGLVTRPKD